MHQQSLADSGDKNSNPSGFPKTVFPKLKFL